MNVTQPLHVYVQPLGFPYANNVLFRDIRFGIWQENRDALKLTEKSNLLSNIFAYHLSAIKALKEIILTEVSCITFDNIDADCIFTNILTDS